LSTLPTSIPNCLPNELPLAEFRALLEAAPPRQRARLIAERERVDVAFFARHVLGAHLRLPFAAFHHRLFAWHRQAGRVPLPHREGRRLAVGMEHVLVNGELVLHQGQRTPALPGRALRRS